MAIDRGPVGALGRDGRDRIHVSGSTLAKPAGGDDDDFRMFLKPMLDLFSAVILFFTGQKSVSHTTRDVVAASRPHRTTRSSSVIDVRPRITRRRPSS